MQNLTTKQKAALRTLGDTFQPAIRLDAEPTTLANLARKGLIERKWDNDDKRWTYRANSTPTVEDRIVDAYNGLAHETGSWVGMAHIRQALPDINRATLDATLLDMVLRPDIMLDPEFNQKTLTPADRAAAIHMGGEDCHLLAIGRR